MQEIRKEENIRVIPYNLEKYMTFFLDEHLKFIDRLQFKNDLLETLTKNITIFDMKYASWEFQQAELMKRIDVYPYDCKDSFDKFSGKNLPAKEKFFVCEECRQRGRVVKAPG